MKLTKTERRESKFELGKWHPPPEMMARAKCLMDRLDDEALFTQGGVDFVTEAWVAADFGEKRGATAVRLIVEAERPDIALHFAHGETEIYEIVEADRPRERGAEYRARADAGYPIYQWPVEEWATAQQAYEVLRRSAEIKARTASYLAGKGTPYPTETRLLFHLNLVDFGRRTSEIEEVMQAAVEPARPWFASLWINWKLQAYQI